MKRYTLIALAAALFPLAGQAEEKPLWEVQGRLDGGKNARLSGWIKDFFTKEGAAAPVGEKAVFRIAGFENKATEEEDWVAEIRDLADVNAVVKELEEKVKPDDQGRYLMEEQGVSFLVWKDGDSLLRLASPPQNAGVTVGTTVPLEGDAWISGWVNLSGISALEGFQSESLELPETLKFDASSAGQGMVLNVDAGLKSKELADTAKTLIESFKAELSAAMGEADKLPPIAVTSDDKNLAIKIELTEAHLDDLIKEVKKAIEER